MKASCHLYNFSVFLELFLEGNLVVIGYLDHWRIHFFQFLTIPHETVEIWTEGLLGMERKRDLGKGLSPRKGLHRISGQMGVL